MSRASSSRDADLAIGWFVSPHGLGHAARSAAIIAALHERRPSIRHHVFTTVPADFFDESLPGVALEIRRRVVDVGMVQHDPLVEDVVGTVEALERLPLADGPGLDRVAAMVASAGCRAVVCDISPVGLAVADRLGLPAVLVENFTWDWIYRAYDEPRLAAFGDRMAELFDRAALRIQTAPVCRPVDGARRVAPVSRRVRRNRTETRAMLGVADDEPMVLLSVRGRDPLWGRDHRLPVPKGVTVVAPSAVSRTERERGVIRTPASGGPYHPDLVAASDLVIAKLGYSTVAEVYHGGSAFAYLGRPRFPESPVLEGFVRRHIRAVRLPEGWLTDSSTAATVDDLLASHRSAARRRNGAADAARLILELVDRQP